MDIMNIKPEYLELIKSGKKKVEFREWLNTEDNYFGLKNNKTKKIEAVIEVFEVIDTEDFPAEEKEQILIDNHVDLQFAEDYNCRYAYLIKKVHNVH